MKKITIMFIAFLALYSCFENRKTKSEDDLSDSTIPNFSKDNPISSNTICRGSSIPFGNTILCLPDIEGYINVYTDEFPEERGFIDEHEDYTVTALGFYINEDSYQNESDEFIDENDYFKVYSVSNFKNLETNSKDIEKLFKMHRDNFMKDNWLEIKAKMKNLNEDFDIDRPILLESYKTNDSLYTLIFLMKYSKEEGDRIMIGAMNIMLIKERAFHSAYFLKYSKENIEKIKSHNDYLALKLIDENKIK